MTTETTGQTTPREKRASFRAQVSRVLRRALDRHDASQVALAQAIGMARGKAGRWTDPEDPEVPGISDIALMPREVALDLLRWVADHHGLDVVTRIETGVVGDHLVHLHTLIREGSDVTSAYSLALADGVIDALERRSILAELEEDIAARTALRQALLADERTEREACAPRGVRRVS